MRVRATKVGLKVPREDNARRYIERDAVDVIESAYYHRQIIDGDLEIVTDDVSGAATGADDSSSSVEEKPTAKKDKGK